MTGPKAILIVGFFFPFGRLFFVSLSIRSLLIFIEPPGHDFCFAEGLVDSWLDWTSSEAETVKGKINCEEVVITVYHNHYLFVLLKKTCSAYF